MFYITYEIEVRWLSFLHWKWFYYNSIRRGLQFDNYCSLTFVNQLQLHFWIQNHHQQKTIHNNHRRWSEIIIETTHTHTEKNSSLKLVDSLLIQFHSNPLVFGIPSQKSCDWGRMERIIIKKNWSQRARKRRKEFDWFWLMLNKQTARCVLIMRAIDVCSG